MPARDQVRLREVNWLVAAAGGAAALHGEAAGARGAAAGDGAASRRDGAEVRLDAPALPAPGQACVFYDGERVLGGGFIRRRTRRRWLTRRGRRGYLPRPRGSDGGVAQR